MGTKNRIIIIIGVIAVLCSSLRTHHQQRGFLKQTDSPKKVVRDGRCGVNVNWTLIEGTLTIYGTGDMNVFSSFSLVPWCNDTSSITSVVIQEGVSSIGDYAFCNCTNLATVKIPDSVASIGNEAFYHCTNLTTVTIPGNITSIEKDVFHGCTSLTTVTIPGSVASIGESAFSHCTNLMTVTIPGNITSIGDSAFYYCINLATVTISGSVTSIGKYAFYHCTNLTTVTIRGNLTSIGECAFIHCTSLATVTIPDSVTSIGDEAFSHCTNLTTVTIPDSVTSIGDGAFSSCLSLISVFYQGTRNFSNSDLFRSRYDDPGYGLTNLSDVCVPPDYAYDTFSGQRVTPTTENCQSFSSLFNSCFKGAYIDGEFIQQKRKNTTGIKDNKSNGCIRYECKNENNVCVQCSEYVCSCGSGYYTNYDSCEPCSNRFENCVVCSADRCFLGNNCGVSQVYVNNTCIDKANLMKENTVIELDLVNGMKIEQTLFNELLEFVTTDSGINPKEVKIGYEVDEQGNIFRVFLLFDSSESRSMMILKLQECVIIL